MGALQLQVHHHVNLRLWKRALRAHALRILFRLAMLPGQRILHQDQEGDPIPVYSSLTLLNNYQWLTECDIIRSVDGISAANQKMSIRKTVAFQVGQFLETTKTRYEGQKSAWKARKVCQHLRVPRSTS